MYILHKDCCKEVIVIDPGEPQEEKLLACFRERDICPVGVILTHEHFDHCAGVNILGQHFDFELYVSSACAENIKVSRKNLSFFAADVCKPFEVLHFVHVVDELCVVKIGGLEFQFIDTPGHSKGSMCLKVEEVLFSGDTLLATKVPVKLPGGDAEQLRLSQAKVKEYCSQWTKVCPGHGECFWLRK